LTAEVPAAPIENVVPGMREAVEGSMDNLDDSSTFISEEEEEEDEVSTSLLLGVVVPISAIIVASLIGNVFMFNKLRRVGQHLPA
jgi:hypothetical protein